jgi:hypothetical protein
LIILSITAEVFLLLESGMDDSKASAYIGMKCGILQRPGFSDPEMLFNGVSIFILSIRVVTVTTSCQKINLTSAEFDLFAILAQNAGTVLSRNEIM